MVAKMTEYAPSLTTPIRVRTLHTWLFAGLLQAIFYSPLGGLLFAGRYVDGVIIGMKVFELAWAGVIFVAFAGLYALRKHLITLVSTLGEQLWGRAGRRIFDWSLSLFIYIGTVLISLGLFSIMVTSPVSVLMRSASGTSFLELLLASVCVIASAAPIILSLKRSHAVANSLFQIESR
jgi:hypothetical protein